MNPHCKIGCVKPKGNLAVLPKSREPQDVADKLRKHVDIILGFGTDKLAGFAIVTWNMDGQWSRGTHVRKDSFVGQTLMPEFVAAVLRRDVSADVTREVLRGEL